MTEVISVRFPGGTKSYYFDPKGLTVSPGANLIVETSQGDSYATCVLGNHGVEDEEVVQPLCPVKRVASEHDLRTVEQNKKKEREALVVCKRKILEHKLEMKLVNVSCNFDGNKIIFFFTADGRVDFRELVKDLAAVFRARIELRQIGVRDEAKMLGGLGICGRPFCCSQFLDGFLPVSIKMAKTQSLSLNPTKISGTCGRLMCCLKYEQDAYEDAVRRCPKQDSFVQTPDGPGNVLSVNLLKETAKVRLDNQTDNTPHCYHNCELCVLRNGKGTREGVEVPRERPARYVPDAELEDSVLVAAFPAAARMTEDPPIREKMGNAEDKPRSAKRRNRGARSTVPGAGETAPQSQPRREPPRPPRDSKAEGRPAPKQDSPPRKPRPEGFKEGVKAGGKDAPRSIPPVKAEGGEGEARRRPNHRGGRRRNRGGGDSTPPTAE